MPTNLKQESCLNSLTTKCVTLKTKQMNLRIRSQQKERKSMLLILTTKFVLKQYMKLLDHWTSRYFQGVIHQIKL